MTSYTPGSFNTMQQVFAMSMWSNLASTSIGDDASLSLILKEKITGTGGKFQTYAAEVGNDWEIVWGPFALSHLGRAANACFVSYSPNQNLMVVAIAATNEASFFDWFVEDFNVAKMVDFPIDGLPSDGAASPAGAMVSLGTSIGVTNIVTKLGPEKGPSLASFLADPNSYLSSAIVTTDTTLVFTGHSLGGALSPTLAAQLAGSASAQKNWAQVLVLPTAGATPGNAIFAGLFGGSDQPFSVPATQSGNATVTVPGDTTATANWNTLVWNTFDVVPHAWDLLSEVFSKLDGGATSIYGAVKPPLEGQLNFLLNKAMAAAQAGSAIGGPYTRLQNLLVEMSPAPTFQAPFTSIGPWATDLANQHIGAYFSIFGVEAIHDSDTDSFIKKLITDIEALFGHFPK